MADLWATVLAALQGDIWRKDNDLSIAAAVQSEIILFLMLSHEVKSLRKQRRASFTCWGYSAGTQCPAPGTIICPFKFGIR